MNTIRRLCTPLLILAFVLHVVLALAHHGGQAPLLPSTTYSIRTSSAAFTVPSVAVIPKTFQANEDVPPNIIEILAVEAAPQLPTTPTGQISRNGERVPENPEIPHNETPSPSTDLVDISDFSETVSISQEPMAVKKRAFLAVVSTLLGYITLNELYHHANLGVAGAEEGREEARWIATSHSWLDRKACQWFGICGAGHLRSQVWFGGHTQRKAREPLQHDEEWLSAWTKGKSRPEDWSDDERVLREIPKYVFDYAPLVHLYSGEQFWPCDIAEHLIHTTPHLNYTPLQARSEHPNLTNLDELNQWKQGRFVYLTSDDNVEERPDWLGGEKNIPKSPPDSGVEDEDEVAWAEWDGRIDGPSPEETDDARKDWSEVGEGSFREQGGERPNPTVGSVPAPPETVGDEQLPDEIRSRVIEQKSQKRIRGGRSDAPAVLVVVDKGHGVVDAFWFYFYSFNLGNVVLNVRFGNHVGDWEHSLVRFHHGKPKAVFISEHSFGEAYTYEAVEKIGKRVRLAHFLPLSRITS